MLIETLKDSMHRNPAKTAIVTGNQRNSRADLGHAVEATAAGLASVGIGYGDGVALWSPKSPEFIIAFFAAMRLGAVVSSIRIGAASQEVGRIAADASLQAIIVDPLRLAAT